MRNWQSLSPDKFINNLALNTTRNLNTDSVFSLPNLKILFNTTRQANLGPRESTISATWLLKNLSRKSWWSLKTVQPLMGFKFRTRMLKFLQTTIGKIREWLLQLKTKENVVHVGPSQLLAPCSHIGTFSEREETYCFQNNNWSIVHGTSTMKVAMEVFHLMLLNTSDILEVLKHQWLILTQERTENATIDQESLSAMWDSEATTSLKAMKPNWPKDCTTSDQSLWVSKWLIISTIITQAFTKKKDAEQRLKMLIMLC